MDFRISAVDSTILAVYVAITLALGLWIGRGSGTLNRFMVGGRDLPWWAVLGSIIATETSAVTFLSIPGLAFVGGGNFFFLQLAIGLIIGRMIVVVWLLPSFFRGELFTAYEVLKSRFGVLTQRTAAGIFIVTRTVADGLRLYLTAMVLGQVTGMSLTVCVLSIGVVTIIYATYGGIRSVVWNDCIQLVVYLIGAVVAIAVMADRLPTGFLGIVEFGRETGRFAVIDRSPFSFASQNLWAGIIGGIFLTLATHGTDQMMVQRYLCSRSLGQARLAVALSGPLVALQFALFLLVGVSLAAWVRFTGAEMPEDNDAVFAAFIVQHMPVGICGLTLAAVFSVAMSTLSSSLSSSASSVVSDFIKRERPTTGIATGIVAEDRRLTYWGRLWTVTFGVLQMVVAIVVIHSPSLIAGSAVNQVITVAGFAAGLIVGVFLLGRSSRRFAQRSGVIGMLVAFLVTSVLIYPPIEVPWAINGWWAALIASSVCFLVAYLIDIVFPARQDYPA